MSESDVKFMFNEMVQRSEQVYMSGSDSLEDKLVNLPSFLEALGSIVSQLHMVCACMHHTRFKCAKAHTISYG